MTNPKRSTVKKKNGSHMKKKDAVAKDDATWQDALATRDDLAQYGDNAIGLFALAIRFSLDDIHTVASESVTDGSDDKKCDLIYIDKEEGVAVVGQCYWAQKVKNSAPANKASDLNTAVAWLLQQPILQLPSKLRSPASELREAIKSGQIRRLEVWYVHNSSEHKNVQNELDTVEITADNLVKTINSARTVTVSAIEVGKNKLEDWYKETLSPILVSDEISFEISDGFELIKSNWKAFVAPIQAKELHRLYKKHKTKLFSANVRDYLGSRKSDANINNGIKTTAETEPENFWVFNNGITVLTHSYSVDRSKTKHRLTIKGASIVNGAQTTGAIGSLGKSPATDVLVPARFVSTNDSELVYSVIQYNNSQNKVTASDFRSTDRIQKRLREEVLAIPNAKYEGGRRGGHKDVIERNKNLLPSYTVGQSLAAYLQDPVVAYNQKSEIWVSDKLYSKYFNDDTTGRNIIFAYGLLRAVEESKKKLIAKSRSDSQLTQQEESLLEYFRHRGATFLLVSSISSCIETFLKKKVANPTRLSFGNKAAPAQAVQNWAEIVDLVSPFTQQLLEALSGGLQNAERATKAIATFRSLVQATSGANSTAYAKFAKLVSTGP
ncbi:AIPR family protein [Stenotrophomonas geniculata]|uniref:AIPR family protein n=1 Tax=Stenotrophomonas geniculata TaxID=86188 RepID=UPI0013115D06|nr:AIPR family protein [Stenotrophomonas geniculata]